MAKIIVIGIDGLDPLLLHQWRDELPTVGALFRDISQISIASTFPPDSICAWTSIYTGQNPAEHGLIESIDYLSSKRSINSEGQTVRYKGKTFWDIIGHHGKKVCVINPFLAYPAWEVNGVMVSGPVFEGGSISTYPDGISQKFNFPPLGGIVDFPAKSELGAFIEKTMKSTQELTDAGLDVYKSYRPDLFFLTFLTLDRVKHFLWRFTDSKDPTYPGETPYKNVIKDFYQLFDAIVKKYYDAADEGTVFAILSDHGHRMRCTHLINLNEYLRQQNLIKTNTQGVKGFGKIIIERSKVLALDMFDTFGMEDWFYRIAKLIPNRKVLKKSTYLVDEQISQVFLGNLCGANPFGGIKITNIDPAQYEKLRDRTIIALLDLNKQLNKKVVLWVKRREEVYAGEYLSELPDVLFELESNYGVGMNFFVPLITKNYTHNKISGGHQKEGVFLTTGKHIDITNLARPLSVIGIKEYLLTAATL